MRVVDDDGRIHVLHGQIRERPLRYPSELPPQRRAKGGGGPTHQVNSLVMACRQDVAAATMKCLAARDQHPWLTRPALQVSYHAQEIPGVAFPA